MLNKFKKIIKIKFRNKYLFYQRLILSVKTHTSSDKRYVEKKHYKNFGKKINLTNPKTYNENISKILLNYDNPLAVSCVDKFKVRTYVKRKTGDYLLNDLYGSYIKTEDIWNDLNDFPNQFVLKATHGCGWNFICQNKNELDWDKLKIELNHWLKSNFYYAQRELIYKNIKPGIICEKFLEDENKELIDYKIHCFNGEPKFINVIVNRFSNMKLNTFDTDWNFIDINFSKHYPNDKERIIEKPEKLRDLLEFSRILSEDFPYVRVDFYIVKQKIYFGELTFTPGNGAYMFNEEEDLYLGQFFNNKKGIKSEK